MHQLGVTDRRALWEDAIATMARLHRADASSLTSEMARQGGATDLGQVAAYCRSLHEWVSEVVPVPEFEPYVDWLERELPVDAPPGLSWGDARPGNMLFRANRCAALLSIANFPCRSMVYAGQKLPRAPPRKLLVSGVYY